jgi:hypothetical protein
MEVIVIVIGFFAVALAIGIRNEIRFRRARRRYRQQLRNKRR